MEIGPIPTRVLCQEEEQKESLVTEMSMRTSLTLGLHEKEYGVAQCLSPGCHRISRIVFLPLEGQQLQAASGVQPNFDPLGAIHLRTRRILPLRCIAFAYRTYTLVSPLGRSVDL